MVLLLLFFNLIYGVLAVKNVEIDLFFALRVALVYNNIRSIELDSAQLVVIETHQIFSLLFGHASQLQALVIFGLG